MKVLPANTDIRKKTDSVFRRMIWKLRRLQNPERRSYILDFSFQRILLTDMGESRDVRPAAAPGGPLRCHL